MPKKAAKDVDTLDTLDTLDAYETAALAVFTTYLKLVPIDQHLEQTPVLAKQAYAVATAFVDTLDEAKAPEIEL